MNNKENQVKMKEATIEELIQLDRLIRGEILVKGFDIEFWTGLVIATSKTNDGYEADKTLEKIMQTDFKPKIIDLEKILKTKNIIIISKSFL